MNETYILRDKKPIICEDIIKWGKWFNDAERHVKLDELPNNVKISTIFLGLDHGFRTGKILLFETMIFGGEHDEYCERYETWEQAEIGHQKALNLCLVK